ISQQADALARTAGLRRPVPVLWSDAAVAPQTVGTRKPVVLLPARWQGKPDPSTLEHALAHELAHVRRGDHRWVWLQFAARILLGFNPAIWIIIDQMNRERENACDDWALALGATPKACASSLLSVAASLTPGCPPELAIPCLRSKNHLRRRISHMLNQEKNHSTRPFGKLTLVAALVAGAGAAVAAPQWIGTIQQLPSINTAGLFSPKRGDESRIPQPEDGLLYAAWTGDLGLAQSLLDAGDDPDAVNRARDPRTALLAAARRQHWDVLSLLIDSGADVNNRARGDESVLMAVSQHDRPDVVEMLLSRGAKPDTRIRGDGTPLIAAARGGNTEGVRLLLQAGADPDVWVDGDESPLFHAVVGGHGEIVNLLLEAGVDPSVAYAGDGTPLMLAIRHGHDDIARNLMAAGAKVDTRVSGDGTALIDAARRNSLVTAEALLAAGADVNNAVRGDGNALINAARRGYMEMSELLLSNGAEVNAHVKGDDTPLINAVWSNNPELVQLLLDYGADPNLEGDYDRRLDVIRTPLNQARANSEIADLLADAGARQPVQQ
ncbi:MAG: ankyrin repeat domain-containing protein, partial [Pseudomonadota bacterium]